MKTCNLEEDIYEKAHKDDLDQEEEILNKQKLISTRNF